VNRIQLEDHMPAALMHTPVPTLRSTDVAPRRRSGIQHRPTSVKCQLFDRQTTNGDSCENRPAIGNRISPLPTSIREALKGAE
jgi:hypothetical protein